VGQQVGCFITRAALIFLAGHFLLAEDYGAVFSTYGDHIIKTARRKYNEAEGAWSALTLTASDIMTYGPEPAHSDETPAPSL
jgi:hypothetical protein